MAHIKLVPLIPIGSFMEYLKEEDWAELDNPGGVGRQWLKRSGSGGDGDDLRCVSMVKTVL